MCRKLGHGKKALYVSLGIIPYLDPKTYQERIIATRYYNYEKWDIRSFLPSACDKTNRAKWARKMDKYMARAK